MKKQDAFVHAEGVTYQSQAFHGGENAAKKGKKGRKPSNKPKARKPPSKTKGKGKQKRKPRSKK